MAVFLRKLFGIGKLPEDLRTAAEAEGIIHAEEYVPVTFRFTGKVPGKIAKGNISSYVGSLVLTNQRVLGTLSVVPKLAGRAVDHPWHGPEGTAVQATLDESGLLLDLPDLAAVAPQFSGTLSLHYKSALSPDLLARLPQRSFSFDVPLEFVYRAVGVPYHP